jgi:hypothetical protein
MEIDMSLVVAAVITKAALAGSGCPATDKVTAHFNDDASELTIDMGSFTTKMRANCEAVLTIEHAPGVKMTPKTAQFNWSGELAKGGSAELTFKYHYQGKPETPTGQLKVTDAGKIAPREDVVAVDKAVASDCGKTTTLILGVAAFVRGPGSSVEVAKASPFRIDWQECPK